MADIELEDPLARTPGVGARGSTPATDQTNLNVAAAMERADIGNRFGFGSTQYQFGVDAPADVLRGRRDPNQLVDSAVSRRRELLSSGVDPDAPARFVTPKRRAELLHEELQLSQIEHQDALTNAAGISTVYRRNKDIATARETEDFFRGMKAIDQLPHGSPEQAQAFYEHLASHPGVATTAVGKDFIKDFAQGHDMAAQLKPPAGMQVESITRDDQGRTHVTFKNVPSGTYETKEKLIAENPNAQPKQNAKGQWYDSGERINEASALRYARLKGDLAAHTLQAKAEAERDKGKPYSKAADLEATKTEIDLIEKQFPGLKAAAPQTDDRKALARRALSDPKATDAHRAAARKILGIE